MADKIEKSKKRKKNADGSSRPSKKVAIGDERNVQISLKDGDEWAPVIASTPGLAIPASISLQPFTKHRKNAPQRPGRSGAIATTEVLLHSSEHPKLDYTAREEEVGGSDTLMRHYVGVYDPKTGKLEVMEARKMVVRGSVRAHQASTEAEVAKQTIRELRNDLGETFGTKKAKKAIASVTENAISATRGSRLLADGAKPAKLDAAKAAIIASMEEATSGMSSRQDLEEQADAAKPRPKADLTAKDIKDVYTIDSLIGEDIYKSVPVLDWEQSVRAKKNITTTSRYVSARIVTAATHGAQKLKILRYLLLLLDLHMSSKPNRSVRMLPKREEMKSKLGDVPQSVIEDIRRKYSDAGTMSKFKSDLLITHACALACLIDNYEVDLYDLQLDLKLETKEMTQYFKEIGARIVKFPEVKRKALEMDQATAAQRKTAKLKLPLDFPRVPFGRRG